VEATTPDGARLRVGARKAVIFASGGFTHDPELRRNFLNVPAYAGCAALTNEGDFVRIGSSLGAQLRNMNYAWMCPVPRQVLDLASPDDPSGSCSRSPTAALLIFIRDLGTAVARLEGRWQGVPRAPVVLLYGRVAACGRRMDRPPGAVRRIRPPGRRLIRWMRLRSMTISVGAASGMGMLRAWP
jgi:hypothetical protein